MIINGIYRVGLYCDASNNVKSGCGDYVDNIIKLQVDNDDFFDQGKQVSSHLMGKIVLCDHKWNIS